MVNGPNSFNVYIYDYTKEFIKNRKEHPGRDLHYVSPWRRFIRLISIAFSFLLVVTAVILVVNKQYVIDQINVWQFTPTSGVKDLADRSGMSDYGKFLYYASQPQLESSSRFNEMCDRVEQTTSVLGCYRDRKIYLYDINNQKLDGIREVTATHETMHAVYDRLGSDEKSRIGILLEAEYKKLGEIAEFKDRMDFYARAEPGQRENELHSVVGTEVANISSELEAYYSKYFSNRQQIVSLNTKYISVFKTLEVEAQKLKDELDLLGASISDRSNKYNLEVKNINKDIIDFNSRSESGYFTSQAQFDAERNLLVVRVSALDSARVTINKDSDRYNKLISELEAIASETKKLYNSLDSSLAPAPSL